MEVFITLADFDIRWGARARESGKEQKKGGGGGEVFKRFRSHIISKYTPAVRSKIWSELTFARLCVILRSRVLIIYVGACYTRGARSMRSCGWWGRRGCWRGGMNESYVMDG